MRSLTTLPASIDTPAAARAFAREVLNGDRPLPLLDDVTLVVSELVTNAVLHGDGDVTLAVVVGDESVQVEVGGAEQMPADPSPAAPDADDGRGLFLVSRLARRWGVRPADGRQVVWAELAC